LKKDHSFVLRRREILSIVLKYPLMSSEEMQRVCPEKYVKMRREIDAVNERYKIKRMLDSDIPDVYDELLRYVALIDHSLNWERHCKMVSKNDDEFERFFHREAV